MSSVHSLRRFSDISSGFVILMGIVGLAGWAFDLPGVRALAPGGTAMSANAALGFALSGLAMVLLERREHHGSAVAGQVLAGAVFAFTAATLVDAAFDLRLDIATLFLHDASAQATNHLGERVPFDETVPLLLSSWGLVTLVFPSRYRLRTPLLMGLSVLNVALLALLSQVLFRLGAGAAPFLSVGSTLACGALGAGLACSGLDTEFIRFFSQSSQVGRMSYLLTAGSLLVPPLLFLMQVLWLVPGLPALHDDAAFLATLYGMASLGVTIFSLRRIIRSEQLRSTAETGREALLARLQQQAATLQYEVSERTQELRTALEQSNRFAHLANHTTNGVVIADASGRIEWVNPAWERCTGYSLEEARGRSPGSLLQGEGTDAATAAQLREAVHRGEPVQAEILNYTKSGQPIWIEVEVQPFRDNTGRIVSYFGIQTNITSRRENEQAVRTLSERLQLALRSADYGVWEMDLASGGGHWDGRALAIYGLPADDTIDSSRWRNLVHPEDLPKIEDQLAELQAGQIGTFATEYRVVLPDGTLRHVESRGYLQRGGDGTPLRVVGLNRDVTASRELQEQLRIAEERWKLALIGSNDGIWDWNPTTGAIYTDERWLEIIGHKPGELSAHFREWEQRIHPDDQAATQAALQSHLTGRTPFFLHEHRLRHKQGHWVWVLDRGKVVARDAQGNPVRVVGTHSDISSRKSLEERLRHSEEMGLQVGRLAQIGAWEWDLRTQRFTWAPELYRIFEVELGFQPAFGKTLEFFPADAKASLSEAFNKAVQFGRPFSLDLPMLTTQSRRRWVRVIGRAEFDHGHVVTLYGAIQDLTERHDAEETRRQLETQLFQAQKMETLGTLAGGIAHDFNNLLTGVLGYQDLALDCLDEQHAARSYLNTAREASLRARELVDQILTFSRDPGGERIPVDLAHVIEDARRFLRSTVPATVRIDVDIAPDCGRVLADATQLHQVLLNLGSNAAHAMRTKDGVMRFALEPVTLSSDQAAAMGELTPGNFLRLTCSDTGHGMDAETIKRIFDPFFTTKNVGEGTGLGLSVVHGIVRAHKGAIEVQSEPGQGSTFNIYLPLAPASDDVEEVQTVPTPRGAGEVIAVVDDEDFVLSFTRLALIRLGYHAVAFDSPVKCLEALRGEHADCALLLTDQTMPGMKGIELAAQVREFAPTMPAIIMSGYFSKISPETLTRIGRVSLIAKPFTADELARAIQKALHEET